MRVINCDAVIQMQYLESRVTAQDLYIGDLEHCVSELQRIIDHCRCSNNAASASMIPDDICDVFVPQRPCLPANKCLPSYDELTGICGWD